MIYLLKEWWFSSSQTVKLPEKNKCHRWFPKLPAMGAGAIRRSGPFFESSEQPRKRRRGNEKSLFWWFMLPRRKRRRRRRRRKRRATLGLLENGVYPKHRHLIWQMMIQHQFCGYPSFRQNHTMNHDVNATNKTHFWTFRFSTFPWRCHAGWVILVDVRVIPFPWCEDVRPEAARWTKRRRAPFVVHQGLGRIDISAPNRWRCECRRCVQTHLRADRFETG